jgi:hypothetical protein
MNSNGHFCHLTGVPFLYVNACGKLASAKNVPRGTFVLRFPFHDDTLSENHGDIHAQKERMQIYAYARIFIYCNCVGEVSVQFSQQVYSIE